MKIDRDEARRIATLAHLEFDDTGLERMAAEMTRILEYIESLPATSPRSSVPRSSVDDGRTGGSEDRGPRTEDTQVDTSTPLREDVLRPSVDRDDVARNAPEWENGFFVVPAVIEGES